MKEAALQTCKIKTGLVIKRNRHHTYTDGKKLLTGAAPIRLIRLTTTWHGYSTVTLETKIEEH